ncbi:hypothetical protein HZS_2082 [Henneguya salminicola]|nr:hypothetical protein HZS_2082 [Henneguya salminicola]
MQKAFTREYLNKFYVTKHCYIENNVTNIDALNDEIEIKMFIAISITSTYFTIYVINIKDKKIKSNTFYYAIPKEYLRKNVEELFDYVAKSIQDNYHKNNRPSWISFSLPYVIVPLNIENSIKCTKADSKKSIAKRDIVELINSACKILNLKILGYALIENTIGTLLCGALENTETS